MNGPFIGFYTYLPLWVNTPVSIASWDDYRVQISERVIYREEQGFKISIYRDGLILLQIDEIENLLQENSNINISDFQDKASGELRQRYFTSYFKMLNIFQLMLDSRIISLIGRPYIKLTEIHFLNFIRVIMTNGIAQKSSAPTIGYTSELYSLRSTLDGRVPLSEGGFIIQIGSLYPAA